MVTIAPSIKLFTSFLFLFLTFFTFALVPVELTLPIHLLFHFLVANETAHKNLARNDETSGKFQPIRPTQTLSALHENIEPNILNKVKNYFGNN